MDKVRPGMPNLYWPSLLGPSPIGVYPGQQSSEIMTKRMVVRKNSKWH